MKKNGFTLIELLLGIVLTTLFVTIATSIFVTGFKQGKETKEDIRLQQEANYVASNMRKDYLNYINKLENEINPPPPFTIEVKADQIILNGNVISKGFSYSAVINYSGGKLSTATDPTGSLKIDIADKQPVTITITFKSESGSYTLRTTLSRGV